MKRLLVTAALLAAWAVPPAGAQQGQQQEPTAARPGAATSGTEVTGTVTSVDEQAHEIVIDGETFVMPREGGGAALMAAKGDRITLSYREEGGQKVITRIGQRSSSRAAGAICTG